MVEHQMASKYSDKNADKSEKAKVKATDATARDSPAAAQAPPRERRSSHRVADDQKSGQGSLSAMSKMQMILRRRAAMSPRDKEPGD